MLYFFSDMFSPIMLLVILVILVLLIILAGFSTLAFFRKFKESRI